MRKCPNLKELELIQPPNTCYTRNMPPSKPITDITNLNITSLKLRLSEGKVNEKDVPFL